MNKLREVLVRYAPRATGGADVRETGSSLTGIDMPALQADLRDLVQKSDRVMWISVICMIILFVIYCIFLILWRNDLTKVSIMLGVTGISFTGMFTLMTNTWKQKIASSTLATILPLLSQQDLGKVVDKLIAVLVP